MSLFSVLGTAAGYALGGPAGAALGATVGGGIDRNAAAADVASEANAFSANQYATRYQTQVKDLQAAGLNPMLAYGQSPGAAPTGQQYQVSNPFERVASDYSSAANVERTGQQIEANTSVQRAEMYLKNAQTELAGTSANMNRAATDKLQHEAHKISLEVKNIPLEGDRLIALAKNLTESIDLIKAQTSTEVNRAAQFKWLAVKTMLESDLVQFDINAIKQAENFGKEFGQYKQAIDTLLDLANLFSNSRGRRSTSTTTHPSGHSSTTTTESNR